MVATTNGNTARKPRIDTLPAAVADVAWSIFQDQELSLSEAIDAALAAGDLEIYARQWDDEAAELLAAAYGATLDEAEIVTPPPPPAAPARRRPAPALELEVRKVGAAYLVESGSRAGLTHTVINGRCSCEAGRFGRACRHLAAIERFQARLGERVAA